MAGPVGQVGLHAPKPVVWDSLLVQEAVPILFLSLVEKLALEIPKKQSLAKPSIAVSSYNLYQNKLNASLFLKYLK